MWTDGTLPILLRKLQNKSTESGPAVGLIIKPARNLPQINNNCATNKRVT